MRITYGLKSTKEYWEKRWSEIELDSKTLNPNVYPLKYALEVVKSKDQKILEAGCGTGRVLRYFHHLGYKIKGIDYIESVTRRLKEQDSALDVERGDITNLHFEDNSFDVVLAFGLYHGLQGETLDKSLLETRRVMKNGARLVASFRADNFQNFVSDYLKDRKFDKSSSNLEFHKLNLSSSEYRELLVKSGLIVEHIYPVENMPLLYKFSFFRDKNHKSFNENQGRSEGYKLSTLGRLIQNTLMKLFPDQFCNLYLAVARKA